MGTFRHFQIFYLLDNPHFQEVAKKKIPRWTEEWSQNEEDAEAESRVHEQENSELTGHQENEERRQQLKGGLQKRPAEKRNQSKLNKTNFSYHLEQRQGTPGYRLNLTHYL